MVTIKITRANFINPYSVKATKPIGIVEIRQPATGIKEHKNTNKLKKPKPGILSTAMPIQVRMVLIIAIINCKKSRKEISMTRLSVKLSKSDYNLSTLEQA